MLFSGVLKNLKGNMAAWTTFVSMWVNVVQVTLKCALGIKTGSYALYADGLHGGQDVLMNLLVLLISLYAAKPADGAYPYGRGRYESLALLLMAILGIGAAWELMLASVTSPVRPLSDPLWVGLVGGFSLGVNMLLAGWMYRLTQLRKNHLILGNALHHLGDALASFAVVVSYLAQLNGYLWADRIASLCIVFLMVYSVIPPLKNAVLDLTDHATEERCLDLIRKSVLSVSEIVDVHHLRSRRSAGRVILDAHITLNHHLSFTESHWIAERLTHYLKEGDAGIQDILFHVDPDKDCSFALNAREVYVREWISLGIPEEMLRPECLVMHYLEDVIDIDWLVTDGDVLQYFSWAGMIMASSPSVRAIRIRSTVGELRSDAGVALK